MLAKNNLKRKPRMTQNGMVQRVLHLTPRQYQRFRMAFGASDDKSVMTFAARILMEGCERILRKN